MAPPRTEDNNDSHIADNHHLFAAKTIFPDFGIPDLDSTDASSSCSSSSVEHDEDNDDKKEVDVVPYDPCGINSILLSTSQSYSCKQDQDVAVFLTLAERLSLQSLVHILQAHVQEQQPHHWPTLVAAVQAQERQKRRESELSQDQTPKSPSPRPKKKAFRFAELRGGLVRQVIHEVEDWKHLQELWWTDEEMMAMRIRAISTVKHYRKNRPNFTAAVEKVMAATPSSFSEEENIDASPSNNPAVESAMKLLCQESSLTRGLETHICTVLSRARSAAIHAVIEEQDECRECQDTPEVAIQAIYEQSIAYSRASRHWALQLGQADHVEALKAALSTWHPNDH